MNKEQDDYLKRCVNALPKLTEAPHPTLRKMEILPPTPFPPIPKVKEYLQKANIGNTDVNYWTELK